MFYKEKVSVFSYFSIYIAVLFYSLHLDIIFMKGVVLDEQSDPRKN